MLRCRHLRSRKLQGVDTVPNRKPITFPYSGESLTQCGKCKATIFFVKTATGKTMPVNFETKESHFADCPAAAQFRKAKG